MASVAETAMRRNKLGIMALGVEVWGDYFRSLRGRDVGRIMVHREVSWLKSPRLIPEF